MPLTVSAAGVHGQSQRCHRGFEVGAVGDGYISNVNCRSSFSNRVVEGPGASRCSMRRRVPSGPNGCRSSCSFWYFCNVLLVSVLPVCGVAVCWPTTWNGTGRAHRPHSMARRALFSTPSKQSCRQSRPSPRESLVLTCAMLLQSVVEVCVHPTLVSALSLFDLPPPTYQHTHTHTHTHAHIHTYTYTHTHTRARAYRLTHRLTHPAYSGSMRDCRCRCLPADRICCLLGDRWPRGWSSRRPTHVWRESSPFLTATLIKRNRLKQ